MESYVHFLFCFRHGFGYSKKVKCIDERNIRDSDLLETTLNFCLVKSSYAKRKAYLNSKDKLYWRSNTR